MKYPLAVAAWFVQNWLKIIIVGGVIIVGCTVKACFEAKEAKRAYHDNPPTPKKEADAMRKKAVVDSAKVVKFEKIATEAKHDKDSLLQIVRTSTATTDSLHAEIRKMPAITGGPLSAIQKQLAEYQHPDTTGF
jgi:FtsZ-interacting cell division protein ZipA